jgi:hypothetical protein
MSASFSAGKAEKLGAIQFTHGHAATPQHFTGCAKPFYTERIAPSDQRRSVVSQRRRNVSQETHDSPTLPIVQPHAAPVL